MRKKKIELLAPAGNMDKLKTALYFGADAIYCSGKEYGLRAAADNFDNDQLKEAIAYVHSKGKKIYVTLNIVARHDDFYGLQEYLEYLNQIKPDAVIVADMGVMSYAKMYAPKLDIHISTQANVTNKVTARMYADMGAKRIIPARECTIAEIGQMSEGLPRNVEIECFVHGAMCMAYSGRCLISNYNIGRPSNSGMCAQPCRYEYTVREKSKGTAMDIYEDERGTYIFNSKDLNMIEHLDDLIKAGVSSFKIEGRVKSQYYVGCVVNAYRRALDDYYKGKTDLDPELAVELAKAGSRDSSTGLYYSKGGIDSVCSTTSKPQNDFDFIANCIQSHNGQYAVVEMRNRFGRGDILEIVSPNSMGKSITVDKMTTLDDEPITDALLVQQHIRLYTEHELACGDLLRRQIQAKG